MTSHGVLRWTPTQGCCFLKQSLLIWDLLRSVTGWPEKRWPLLSTHFTGERVTGVRDNIGPWNSAVCSESVIQVPGLGWGSAVGHFPSPLKVPSTEKRNHRAGITVLYPVGKYKYESI